MESQTFISSKPEFEPITPFHVRDQLWDLIYGPGNIKEKFHKLSTTSRSRFRIRERILNLIATPPAVDKDKTCQDTKNVISALQAKLEKEGKTGFHLGLIADGNRRWAVGQGSHKLDGHQHGFTNIVKMIFPLVASIPQITEFSIYLLSHENLKRDKAELDNLYRIFENGGYSRMVELGNQYNIQYRHAGEKEGLPAKTQELLSQLERDTAQNRGIIVNLCINFDAQTESGHAMKILASEGIARLENMSAEEIAREIQERSWIPTPADAVIRTGGDPRFSGFLGNRPFDINCHLLVEKKFLPSLTKKDLLAQLLHFANGERRMGI